MNHPENRTLKNQTPRSTSLKTTLDTCPKDLKKEKTAADDKMPLKPNKNLPPWQVLGLLAPHLDPKTLAMASCVSKSWFISMSSDHLWEPICTAHFPSLSTLHSSEPAVPYRRLYALGHTSARRRHRKPPRPRLSLNDLIFTVTVHNNNARTFSVVKSGAELEIDRDGVFRFDMEVGGGGVRFLPGDALDELKVTWNVVLEGFKGVFTMMDCRGKGRFVLGSDGWFSEELPAAGCCSGMAASGLVADLRLGLEERENGGGGGGRRTVVEKVGVGVLNILNWRYVSVDDALRYLQHFLMPSFV